MQIPLQISLHGIGHSDALYDDIRQRAQKLERYYDHIASCRVVLELGARSMEAGVRLTTEVRIGNPTDEINAAAIDYGSDLIVMSTHGRTGLPHLLLGSIAERVLRTAPCPVLAVRQALVEPDAEVVLTEEALQAQ